MSKNHGTSSLSRESGRHLRLVAYQRVSTDDKGQDPERQGDVLRAWALREGHEIVAHVNDLGTSGAVPPLLRPKVKEAIQLAQKQGCDGLLVEAVDRWTREGPDELAVSRFFLRLDHKMSLCIANTPFGLPPAMEKIWDTMMAAMAEAWLERHRQAVKSGYARARKLGFPNGKPGPKEKPFLNRDELDYIAYLQQDGQGWRKIALEISRIRGAWDATDVKRQRHLRVGPTWVLAELRRVADRSDRRCYRKALAIEVDNAHPEAAE